MEFADHDPTTDTATPVGRWLVPAIVGIIMLLAAALRFTGLNWDLAQWIHPDEGHMRMITGAVSWPDDLSAYFDTGRSPLNPRNHDQVYSYGTLPLFATRAVAEWLDGACGNEPAPLPALVVTPVLTRLGQGHTISPPGLLCQRGTFTWTYNAYVGRHLSALADIGTVVLIGLLARELYNRRTALLAMALVATTAFMIQQAHFYTVDSAATFFTVLTAAFAVKAGQAPGRRAPWGWLGLGGFSSGLAAACKVSAVLAAGLVALGGLQWAWTRIRPRWHRASPQNNGGRRGLVTVILPAAGALVVAALLSIVAFRVGQPYAFEGPGFFGVRPNAPWFDRLSQIREEQSGAIDYPSGRQWTARLPVVFPLRNLGIWGLGLPLGVAVAAGWAAAGWRLSHGDRRHFVLWLWTTAYVAFYATRWVKAMRYFLPAYPFLILMAAYGLERMVTRALRRRPAALPPAPQGRASFESPPSVLSWLGPVLAGIVLVSTTLWGVGLFRIYVRPHTRVAASRWIYANVPDGSVVANEHWDWGLPLRIDGNDPFRSGGRGPAFEQITLELYNEDTPEKRQQLLSWLDQADYIFLASNRLYGSIPRLPERYPLTTTYYRALFAGELGFELAAEITSYIRIGPFVFSDQENPFPLMAPVYATQDNLLRVPLPPAEESFSVYDHPNCLIFRKTEAYTREGAQALLGAVDLTQVATGQSPQEATGPAARAAHGILFYAGLFFVAVVGVAALLRHPD